MNLYNVYRNGVKVSDTALTREEAMVVLSNLRSIQVRSGRRRSFEIRPA